MRARQNDLRPPAGDLDANDIGADAVALAVAFPRHLFLLRQDRVRPSQVHDDVALFKALHDTVYQLSFASLEFVVDDLALGIAQALDDILLGGLRRDPTEQARVKLAQQLVANLGVRIERVSRFAQSNLGRLLLNLPDHCLGFEQLDLADLRIELRLDLALVAELLLGRRDHGVFQGAHENRLVDSLFLADLFDNSI